TKLIAFDVNSLKTVALFCHQVIAEIQTRRWPRLAAIICTEVYWRLSGAPTKSEDGFEQSMAINHLAHFALCSRLLGGMDSRNGRMVFIGSQAHWPEHAGLSKGFPTKLPGSLNDLIHPQEESESIHMGRGFQRYAISKLVIILVMYELNRRLKKAVAVDPLDLTTSIGQAARAVVDVAISDEFAGSEGYFEGRKKVESSPDRLEKDIQRVLWKHSVAWCDLKECDSLVEL
ncbi:hypothetical protein EK21DRAFT_70328, partial [Setomelanomma holmii]